MIGRLKWKNRFGWNHHKTCIIARHVLFKLSELHEPGLDLKVEMSRRENR